ncbi:MAG: hypothetical protein AAF539_04675 [Planctomycetota bacterium]
MGRRTRFQLTPLLDLLLIIVFAQFLDVRETAQEQTTARQQSRTQLRDAQTQRDLAIAQRAVDADAMTRAINGLRQSLAIDAGDVDTFGFGSDNQRRSVDAAIQSAEELSQSDPASVLRFMIAHGELLKRADVWAIHASDRDDISLMAPNQTETFRLEASAQAARRDEVIDQLFAAFKKLPQPKGLVVVMVSYAPRSVAGVYQPLVDAIPETLRRLRRDAPTTRFEYTVLGTSPTPVMAFSLEPNPVDSNDSRLNREN